MKQVWKSSHSAGVRRRGWRLAGRIGLACVLWGGFAPGRVPGDDTGKLLDRAPVSSRLDSTVRGLSAASAADRASRVDRVPVASARMEAYAARRPKSVMELQPFRETVAIQARNGAGGRGTASLVNLNPAVNAWFLLELEWEDGAKTVYHLENPADLDIGLDRDFPQGIVIRGADGLYACDLWGAHSALAGAQAQRIPYVPLCEGRVYLRNQTVGHKTTREWATDFLRTHVWQGEQITAFVREKFYKDAFLATSEVVPAEMAGAGATRRRPPGAPARPLVDSLYVDQYLIAADLGIEIENESAPRMLVGRWYRAVGVPGVFVSAIQPKLVDQDVIEAQKGAVRPLDEIEASAMVYLVAFDLDRFELGFALGTEHPRVDWSDRVPRSVRVDSLPGPDGIGAVAPLVRTGMMNPVYADRVMATFVGGFKRYHGAFRRSDLALRNGGSHYGFIEQGVVLSKLQPGLATVVVYEDGDVTLKTWTEAENADLGRIRHARQNGVALIEYDESTRAVRPGALVAQPALGSWSGSVDGRYRTVRAGVCLQEFDGRRFLLYGYFSAATPSAMARVFQAYAGVYAMQLDINALEHTYLAVYPRQEGAFRAEHLVKGMSVLDRADRGQVAPRFVGYADNRDFFYLLEKGGP